MKEKEYWFRDSAKQPAAWNLGGILRAAFLSHSREFAC